MSNRNGETWGNIEKVLFVFRQIVERDLRKNPSCVCVCEYFRVHGQYNHQLLTTRVRLIRDPQKHTMVTILTQSEEAFQDQWDMAGKHKKNTGPPFFLIQKLNWTLPEGGSKTRAQKFVGQGAKILARMVTSQEKESAVAQDAWAFDCTKKSTHRTSLSLRRLFSCDSANDNLHYHVKEFYKNQKTTIKFQNAPLTANLKLKT